MAPPVPATATYWPFPFPFLSFSFPFSPPDHNAFSRLLATKAYFYGFWKNKRIVLYDTILQQVDKKGILAILAHELGTRMILQFISILGNKKKKKKRRKGKCSNSRNDVKIGHWSLNHTLLNLVISEVNIFIFFYLFGMMINSSDLYTSFGFSTQPVRLWPSSKLVGWRSTNPSCARACVSLCACVCVCRCSSALRSFRSSSSLLAHLIGFLINVLSRHFEYQADAFAVQQGHHALAGSLSLLSF
jgi:Zn-dependent protease with chaperone function